MRLGRSRLGSLKVQVKKAELEARRMWRVRGMAGIAGSVGPRVCGRAELRHKRDERPTGPPRRIARPLEALSRCRLTSYPEGHRIGGKSDETRCCSSHTVSG